MLKLPHTATAARTSACLPACLSVCLSACGMTHRVEVNSLKIVAKSEIDALKGVEETKRKTYRCVCWVAGGAAVGVTANDLASKLDTLKELKVAQRTPLRVAHRRTGMVREKIIYSMSAELISSRIFILDMDTSAGTYVKEFVHGDLGECAAVAEQTQTQRNQRSE